MSKFVQPHAGGGKGFYFVPEIGEEVLVDFENQNPERPFVVGSHYNGNQKSGFATNDNKIKAIQTRSGHKLIFNEDESIIIADKSGNEIKLDTNGGNIEISAPENICLNAGNNMDIQVGNNLNFSVGNTVMMNIFQKMFINTPFMQQLVADYFHTQAGKALINSENEIKIEARETNVAGTQKLLMHSDEEATVNSKGVAQLHGERKNNYSNISADYETQKEEIKPKCIVKFRPHDKWKGEFGFDWLREGDSGQRGDYCWWGKVIGRYYKEKEFKTLFDDTNEISDYFKLERDMYNRKLKSYTNLAIPYKKHKDKIYLYPIPMLTFLKGEKALFNLKIEITEKPKKLTFEFADDDTTTYLKLDKTEITDIRQGKYTLYNQFSIECTQEFDEMKVLYVKADDEICGAVKIHPNSSDYMGTKKVVFIKVETNLNGTVKKGEIKNGAKEHFINILKQAFIKPDITEEKDYLDCTGQDFKTKFATWDWIDFENNIYGYKISKTGKTKEQIIQLKNNLQAYLEAKAQRKFRNKYDDYYKIYLVNESASWNAYADNKAKFAVCFDSYTDETIIHELLHLLGLPHTFASVDKNKLKAVFTYEQGQTNNIMDYSHKEEYGKIRRITLFHWQWRIINPEILELHRGMGVINRLKKWIKSF